MNFFKKYALVIGICLLQCQAFAQLTIRITAVPSNTPANANLFVAGSFNNWNPGDVAYRLTPQATNEYSITLPASIRGNIEFKFTRGNWASVETQANGSALANRTFSIPATGTATFTGTIARWEDLSATVWPAPGSSASPNVRVANPSFPLRELNRSRRIWAYLPPDYATSNKRYPVLYMHDAQNLFDRNLAFGGNEWGVDEALDQLYAAGDYGCIVIGIDNDGAERLNEYSPYVNSQYGGGQGDEYVAFIVESLKPSIDNLYRTLPEPEHTGIMGSSMGGLISLYAIAQYPQVFGKAGIFSPAFWFSNQIYTAAKRTSIGSSNPKIYMMLSRTETSNANSNAGYVRDVRRMADSLAVAGYRIGTTMDTLSRPDGAHSEWFWRREFPAAYRWMFSNTPTSIAKAKTNQSALLVYPNPDTQNGGIVNIELTYPNGKPVALIINSSGKIVDRVPLLDGKASITTAKFSKDIYTIKVGKLTKRWLNR